MRIETHVMTGRQPRHIVLVGGGHAHVHVMTAFAKQPEPGVSITLVTRNLDTPYSGMLPGLVAGHYRHHEAHIDLARLTRATGARLLHAAARGIDRADKMLLLQGQPSLAYDLLSINVGITPALDEIAGAAQFGFAVKPIGDFLKKFQALLEAVLRQGGPRRIVVVGGGAGGVELLLSLRHRLLAEASAASIDVASLHFALATSGPLLATHNGRVRQCFRGVFHRHGIDLHENRTVSAIDGSRVQFADGESIAADAVLVTTGAAAPGWLRDTGLELDGGGFIKVGPSLQAQGTPEIFAAGDCAALPTPRENAGVFAVRAGPPLARNLRAAVRGEQPVAWHPQRRHLALISTGGRYAVASRGWLKAEGGWVWRLKEWIDRRWIKRYQQFGR